MVIVMGFLFCFELSVFRVHVVRGNFKRRQVQYGVCGDVSSVRHTIIHVVAAADYIPDGVDCLIADVDHAKENIAQYIDYIAECGEKAYDITMYVKVWLGGCDYGIPGLGYPGGGALLKALDI